MHSSRMRIVRALPKRGVSMTESPQIETPPWTETPGQKSPWTETPWTETPLDRDPPVDRQAPVKTLPSQTSFADGNKSEE